jgi:hypothetical protein
MSSGSKWGHYGIDFVDLRWGLASVCQMGEMKAGVRLMAEAEFGKPPQALGPYGGRVGWGGCRIYRVEVLNDVSPNFHREASSAHLGVWEGENDFGRVADFKSSKPR